MRQAKAETSDREERPGQRSVTRFGGGANLGVVKGDLGRELGDEGARIDQPIPTEEVGQVVVRMLQLIRLRDITPVIVVDDSDRWLSDADKATVDVFFGRIMRWVAALNASMVVAVHETYREAKGYQQARSDGWIEEEIWIPALTDSSQLGRLLSKRVTARAADRRLDDAFEVAAVDELFGYYLSGAKLSLRRTLTVCQEAVRQVAKDPEANVVTAGAARSAVAEFA